MPRPRPPATATRVLRVPAEQVWDVVTDVRNHTRWVPMTRIDATAGLRVGDRFEAVSGPFATAGAPGLADRMVIERLDPPSTAAATSGLAVYRKLGPVLLGTAEVRVRPLGPDHCALTWVEDVHLRGLPAGATARVLRPVLGTMLRVVMARASAELRAAT
ncbi:SRPBCC family protein [Cellulomonas sp. KRMCY2]|uniref:SRPBCC family protein n=1 Tax=Cellulomonas sp. KRMCY2 TaxID=1304865 RepID=UPI0018CC1974|nr:SRPBCC family protein [Cellulomonas sp. KRMCY2]